MNRENRYQGTLIDDKSNTIISCNPIREKDLLDGVYYHQWPLGCYGLASKTHT